MLGTDLDQVERGDGASPNHPEALRLEWLHARAMGFSLRPLLDLIGRYLDRGFSIPEIDVFIDEQLANARSRLPQVRQDGSMTERRLRLLERTIESAAARRERSRVGHDPMLAHALAMAAELEEIRTH